MKKLLIFLVVCIYVIIGVYFQHSKIIIEPAYFALYGFTFGVLLDRLVIWNAN